MGAFDDLIPGGKKTGAFDDLIPKANPALGQVTTDPTGQRHMRPFDTEQALPQAFDYVRQHQLFQPDPNSTMGAIYNAPLDFIESILTGGAHQMNMATKGVRDLGVGLAELPFDVAQFFTGHGGETADAIGKAVPQIDSSGLGEDIGAAATQYAVPGVAGYKLARAAPAVAKLPALAQKLIGYLGGAAGDVAATDPDQAQTLGTAFGVGPTNIEAGDSDLTKRMKVGAESMAVAPVVEGTLKTAGKVAGWLKNVTAPMYEKGQRRIVGGMLNDAGITDQHLADAHALSGDGYQATVGTAANTEDALNLEKGIVNEPKYVQRVRGNEAAISRGVDQTLDSTRGAQPDATRQFLEREHQGMLDSADAAARHVEEQLGIAQADHARNEAQVAANANTKQQASADFAGAYGTRKEADTAVKSQMYGEAERLGRATPVDPTPFIQDARAIRAELGRLTNPDPRLGNIITTLDHLETENGVQTVTAADLVDALPKLSKAVDASRTAMTGDTTTRILRLRDGIRSQLETLAANGDPAAVAWQQAEGHFRTEFAPKYREGVGGAVDQAERRGKPVPDTALAGQFLKPNNATGATEAVDQIRYLLRQPDGANAARRYLVGSMADTVKDGRVDPARLREWMQRNSIALDAVPGARQETQQMLNRIEAGSNSVGRLETELEAARNARKMTQEELDKSPTAFWIGTDPDEAIGRIMSGQDKVENITQLLAAARKDQTGQAVEGLKNAVMRNLNKQIRNVGREVKTGNAAGAVKPVDLKVSLAKANELLLEGSPSRRALEAVLSRDQMAALDLYRKRLSVMARINEKGTSGSDSTALLDAAANLGEVSQALNVSQGSIQGNAISRFFRFIQKHTVGDPKAKIRNLLAEALTDPEKARVLMLEYNANTAPTVERQLLPLLVNNLAATATDESPH